MKKAAALISLIFIISCGHKHYNNPHILIETAYGDIEAELYPAKAPKSVTAFLSYIDSAIIKKLRFIACLRMMICPQIITRV